MDIEDSIRCDKILERFRGNKTIQFNELQIEYQSKNDMMEYNITTNLINLLIYEGMLQRNADQNLILAPRGYYTISDIPRLGYQAQYNNALENKRREFFDKVATYTIQIIILIVAIITMYYAAKAIK